MIAPGRTASAGCAAAAGCTHATAALRRMLYPPTDVGPVGLSWLVAKPERLPPRADAARRADRLPLHPPGRHRPGSMPRTAERTAHAGRMTSRPPPRPVSDRRGCGSTTARRARSIGSCSAPASTSGPTAIRCSGPSCVADLRTRDGAPLLGAGFESSIPGLHFVGAFAAASFGPVMRFVSGTPFTGRALAAHVARRASRRRWCAPSPRRRPPEADALGAVVTGASYRALAVVRSLGRRGVRVRVVRSDEHALAGPSRYAQRAARLAAGRRARAASTTCSTSRSARGCSGWVLIPTHDEEAALIARHRDALAQRYRVTTPGVGDAARRLRQAPHPRARRRASGLDQPWTMFPEREDGARAGRGPLPRGDQARLQGRREPPDRRQGVARRRPGRPAPALPGGVRAGRPADPDDPGAGRGQRRLAALVCGALLGRRGRRVARRVGASASTRWTSGAPAATSRRSTTRASSATPAAAARACASAAWSRSSSSATRVTGANLLLDVNPRAWGWQSLGARAGVDFPYLLWRLAIGRPHRRRRGRSRACAGCEGAPTCSPPPESSLPAGSRSATTCARCAGRSSSPCSRRDDPLPSLAAPLLAARLVARRLARRAARCRQPRWATPVISGPARRPALAARC